MQLIEQHVIKQTEPRYPLIAPAAFAAKNLHTAANYLARQVFLFEQTYYYAVNAALKQHEAYCALPRKVSSATGRLINADVNGNLNMLRKAIPNAPSPDWAGGVVVHPGGKLRTH